MPKKTILVFIDWYRPGYRSGGTVTSFGNFVDQMEKHFLFKIVTRDSDYLDSTVYDTITSDSWNEIMTNQCFYLSKTSKTFAAIKNIIKNTPHDYIYINGVFSLYFSMLPLVFIKDKPCILNPHGMLSSQAFSVKPLKKKVFLKIADLLRVYRHVIFHVSNEEEASAVRKHIKNYKAITIASQFTKEVSSDLLKNGEKNRNVRFVNIARVSIEKGTLNLIHALMHVKQALQVDLYGPIYDTNYWSACEHAMSRLPSHISVNYKGILHNDKVHKTLSEYDYFILLSEGENFGHAIFEALSVGLPVIISDNTPWQNLQEKNIGWDVNLKDHSAIHAILETAILKNKKAYRDMSKSAIAFANLYAKDDSLMASNLNVFNY